MPSSSRKHQDKRATPQLLGADDQDRQTRKHGDPSRGDLRTYKCSFCKQMGHNRRTCLQRKFRSEDRAPDSAENTSSRGPGSSHSNAGTNSLSEKASSTKVKLQSRVKVHKPTESVQASKQRVESAIERLQSAASGVAFDEANDSLRVALNLHTKVATCSTRCDTVAENFVPGSESRRKKSD